MHRTTPRFWRDFEKLPESVQKVARRNILFLKTNPRHPSLHFKEIDRFWIHFALVLLTELSLWKTVKISSGFGSVIMTNISE